MNKTKKLPLCEYKEGETDDHGIEAINLYLPVQNGYILHTVVHSVHEKKACDTWRLGPVYHCDDSLLPVTRLTCPRAEWEMALRLQDTPDFIGGVAHGDEKYEELSITLDGRPHALCDLKEKTAFETLSLTVRSKGFDPSNPTEQVLRHTKTLTAAADGVEVDQTVEWLATKKLTASYMAMMPPLKEHTNRYQTEKDEAPSPIVDRKYTKTGDFHSLCLTGEKYAFTMTVKKYLTAPEGNTYLITDNGGDSYHKMYFVLAHGGEAKEGDVWHTQTHYQAKTL